MAANGVRQQSPASPRTMPVRQVLILVVATLSLAALFNANSLAHRAQTKPYGANRDVWLKIWEPVQNVSNAFYLDRPRALVDAATGRQTPGGGGSPFSFPSLAEPALASADPSTPTAVPSTDATPTPLPTVRPPTQQAPLRLWVGGDSLAGIYGQSLVRLATDSGVIDARLEYKLSTGLTRPDYFDWPSRLAEVLREENPDVVVVIFGANDSQGVLAPDGSVYQVQTDGWRHEYARRVGAVMDELRAPGRLVVWTGLPPMRDAEFSDRLGELDSIYKLEAALRPGVAFVNAWDLFSDPASGGYAAYLKDTDGDIQLVREPDGVHLTRAGGDRLASAAFAAIGSRVSFVPATPTPVVATFVAP